jgi:two-component system, OmpR family, alkaline phosphatase synthesis response regulator PhoP
MEAKRRRILVADDEPDILELLEYNLQKQGFEVRTASNGDEALAVAKEFRPHLVILDVMMPGKTGVEVCTILRAQEAFKETLIIFLTAVSDEASQIKGLTAGADDYISKPISPNVLVTKVKALLRRLKEDDNTAIEVNGLLIDPQRFIVVHQGKEFLLAKKEFELLNMLARKPGRVFLRNEILSQVWGGDVIVGDRTIDVHVRKIRQKLDIDCITTVKGVGYKFDLSC